MEIIEALQVKFRCLLADLEQDAIQQTRIRVEEAVNAWFPVVPGKLKRATVFNRPCLRSV